MKGETLLKTRVETCDVFCQKKFNDDSTFIVKKHPEKVLNLEVLICYIFIFYSLFVANYVSVVTALNK